MNNQIQLAFTFWSSHTESKHSKLRK